MEILTAALDMLKRPFFIYCPEKSRRKRLSVVVNNCKHPGNRGSIVFLGRSCYLVIPVFMLIIELSPSSMVFLFVCAIAISLKKRLQKGGGLRGYLCPCYLRGFYPTLPNFHLPLFTRSLLCVTTFTCFSFCLNLYVLDKKKQKNGGEKSLIEEQSPCNHKNPSAGQPMAVHDRTNRNRMGNMLLALNSSP